MAAFFSRLVLFSLCITQYKLIHPTAGFGLVFTVAGIYVKVPVCIVLIAFVIVKFTGREISLNRECALCLITGIIAGLAAYFTVNARMAYPRQQIKKYVPEITESRGFYYFLETGINKYQRGTWNGEAHYWHYHHMYEDDYAKQSLERYMEK